MAVLLLRPSTLGESGECVRGLPKCLFSFHLTGRVAAPLTARTLASTLTCSVTTLTGFRRYYIYLNVKRYGKTVSCPSPAADVPLPNTADTHCREVVPSARPILLRKAKQSMHHT